MKYFQLKMGSYFKKSVLLSSLVLVQFITAAQDSAYRTANTTESESLWYMQPWAWITGAIAVLLLFIALFAGGKKKQKNTSRTDRVIITKTVRTETGIDE